MSIQDDNRYLEQENIILSISSKLDVLLTSHNQTVFAKKRADDIYSQLQHNSKLLQATEKADLCEAYTKMERAKTENDILTFALYCYKQTEAIVNIFLGQLTAKEVFDDMGINIGSTRFKLIHKVFSNSGNSNFTGFNLDKQIVEDFIGKNKLPSTSNFTYQHGIRYFTWYFDNKLGTKAGGTVSKVNDNFIFIDNPYYYLSTARNKIHGGQKKPPTTTELTRLSEIQSREGKFFDLFQHLLYEMHKRFFVYKNL